MESETVGVGMAIGIAFGALIGLAIAVFYLLTLHKCLNRVSPQNRAMAPALVWLNLIPFVGMVWNFFVVLNISKSLIAEGQMRRIDFGDGGKLLGLIMASLAVASLIPLLGMLASVGALVCWILYWVKIAGYSNQLATTTVPVAPALPTT